MKQEVVRKHKADKWSLDDVIDRTEVSNFERAEQVRAPPAEGVYVHGIFLDGGGWNRHENQLIESEPKKLFTPLPVLFITASEWPRPCSNPISPKICFHTFREGSQISMHSYSPPFTALTKQIQRAIRPSCGRSNLDHRDRTSVQCTNIPNARTDSSFSSSLCGVRKSSRHGTGHYEAWRYCATKTKMASWFFRWL